MFSFLRLQTEEIKPFPFWPVVVYVYHAIIYLLTHEGLQRATQRLCAG